MKNINISINLKNKLPNVLLINVTEILSFFTPKFFLNIRHLDLHNGYLIVCFELQY